MCFLVGDVSTVERVCAPTLAELGSRRAPLRAAFDGLMHGALAGDPRAALVRATELLDLATVAFEAAHLVQTATSHAHLSVREPHACSIMSISPRN